MVRRCCVNFQCRGVLLIWLIIGQGPIALAVGAGGGCLDIFSLVYLFSFLSPSLWETARYRLKYCLKGPLNPKQPTKLTNQVIMALHTQCKQNTAVENNLWLVTKSTIGDDAVTSSIRTLQGNFPDWLAQSSIFSHAMLNVYRVVLKCT